jgi:hypothetical protein
MLFWGIQRGKTFLERGYQGMSPSIFGNWTGRPRSLWWRPHPPVSPVPVGQGDEIRKEGLAPLLDARLIESYKASAPSGTLLGANNPCRRISFSPFWGVQRGKSPLERECKGVSPLISDGWIGYPKHFHQWKPHPLPLPRWGRGNKK